MSIQQEAVEQVLKHFVTEGIIDGFSVVVDNDYDNFSPITSVAITRAAGIQVFQINPSSVIEVVHEGGDDFDMIPSGFMVEEADLSVIEDTGEIQSLFLTASGKPITLEELSQSIQAMLVANTEYRNEQAFDKAKKVV